MSKLAEREEFAARITEQIKDGWVIAVTFPAEVRGDAPEVLGPMVLAPYMLFKHRPKTSTMAYAVASDSVTGSVHKVTFDTVDYGGSAGYALVRDTFDVAYLSPLSEAPDLRPDWRAAKKMLFSSSASEAYLMELGLLL